MCVCVEGGAAGMMYMCYQCHPNHFRGWGWGNGQPPMPWHLPQCSGWGEGGGWRQGSALASRPRRCCCTTVACMYRVCLCSRLHVCWYSYVYVCWYSAARCLLLQADPRTQLPASISIMACAVRACTRERARSRAARLKERAMQCRAPRGALLAALPSRPHVSQRGAAAAVA